MTMQTLTREQLEDRLLALHKASLELIQDISLESLLERIATLACEQANAQYAALGVNNEQGRVEQFIPIGMTEAEIEAMPHPPLGLGLIGALMNKRESIRLPDLTKDTRSSGFPKGHPEMTSFLGVPIMLGERNLGQIYLTNKLNGPEFTPDDQLLIEMLAAYAAVAISNAKMYRSLIQRDRILTRRNENLALLNELSSTLATSSDINEILEKALNQIMDYLQLEVGEFFIMQEDRRSLKRKMHRGLIIDKIWQNDYFKLGEGFVGVTAKDGLPRLLDLPFDDENNELAPIVSEKQFRQLALLPLHGRRGILGVLCVGTIHPQPLDELELQFLAAISSWVGTAIENMQLNLQGRRLAILEERERIGMDLHDGIIQSIYAVGLTLEHARLLLTEDKVMAEQRIEQSIADLNSAIRDIRSYILDLRPRQLHDESLMNGIQRLTTELRANTLLEINLQGPSDGFQDLNESHAIVLFHICQEAMANIAKHARAHSVNVTLWKTPQRVLLEVSDDGRGFDFEHKKMSIGHGLANMQTRARNVGGDVEFTSDPGQGTTVLAWVPYERAE
ncbi:MAG TPA: GAF domain-containing sensor histidine kinase [Anaerolineaceae bacterium]|nr:GAF domain-containing sensor histidine kinase [Anaerolineaceae bacterium]